MGFGQFVASFMCIRVVSLGASVLLVKCHSYFGKVPERPGGKRVVPAQQDGFVPLAAKVYLGRDDVRTLGTDLCNGRSDWCQYSHGYSASTVPSCPLASRALAPVRLAI